MIWRLANWEGLAATSWALVKKPCSAGDKPVVGIGEQVVDLGDLSGIAVELTRTALRTIDLVVQKAAVHAFDRHDMRALPEKAATRLLGKIARLDRPLPRKPWGIDVGDIMFGSLQTELGGLQSAETDTDDS
jgi:hypothetical protein